MSDEAGGGGAIEVSQTEDGGVLLAFLDHDGGGYNWFRLSMADAAKLGQDLITVADSTAPARTPRQ